MILDNFDHAFRLAPPLGIEIKAAPNGTIEGYASTFGGEPDRQGDVVSVGAFTRTLREHKAEGTSPSMLWAHLPEKPVGRWTDLREDGKGLFVSGELNLKTAGGREAFEHVSAGDVGAFSVGYLVPEGGRKYRGDGSFALLDLDLVEVSVVAVPANPRARITSVKSLTSKSELVDLLREVGLAKAAAARVAAGGWPALAGEDHLNLNQKALELAAVIDRATAQIRRS